MLFRPGDHVTIVSFSKGVQLSLEAAKELEAVGVSAEVRAFFFNLAIPVLAVQDSLLNA